ncbi:MAG TPA: glycosyltransferase family 9 protein [Nitrospira sp.]|nr:glycosyltransferase family 9 protein [Nitrospira sp.]
MEGHQFGELFAGSIETRGELSRWLSRSDIAVIWARDDTGKVFTAAARCGAKEVIVGSPFSPALTARHQRDRFLEILGEPPEDPCSRARLAVPEPLMKRGIGCLESTGIPRRPVALVHPGSGSTHKCADPEILVEVIKTVQNDGLVPVLLEGPADQSAVGSLLAALPSTPFILRGFDLPTLAGVLAQTRLFVGHDSGVTHLAALLGVPTVALFGPTDRERWAPQGAHVSIASGTSCLCPDWEQVTHCSPKPCLVIPPEEILKQCRTRLALG